MLNIPSTYSTERMAKNDPQTWTHRVKAAAPAGIVAYCARHFPILGSKSAARKALADGRLLLNGRPARPSDRVRPGDRLELRGAGLSKARDYDAELDIVYEDDWLVIVNKPGGIAVNGNRKKTVENALAGSVAVSSRPDALPRPVAVHRIDVPTKGLVLLAKTKTALIELSRAFQSNEVDKEYLAVVHGQTPPRDRIEAPIQEKEAITEYELLETTPSRVYGHLSLLRLYPVTGRTHQLRIHLRDAGHLILGDKAYAKGQRTLLGKGLFLCACKLAFAHPGSGDPVAVEIDAPSRFGRVLQRERERY